MVTGIYKQMAEALAKQGIASLRYDKRTFAAISQPSSRDDATMRDFVGWENIVGDAKASLAYLQQQPEVDSARTALLGHSEGSIVIMQIYADGISGAKPPAATILTSAPGRTYDALLREQLVGNLATAKSSPDETNTLLRQYDTAVASIKQTGTIPNDLPALVAQVLPTSIYGKFFQSICKVDPAAIAATISGSVLVINGKEDAIVSPERDTALIDAALAKRKPDDHETYIVPSMGHMFNDTSNSLNQVIPHAATDKLGSWARAKLGSSTGVATTPAAANPPLPATGRLDDYAQFTVGLFLAALIIGLGWWLRLKAREVEPRT